MTRPDLIAEPRPYRDEGDIAAMRALLAAGRQAGQRDAGFRRYYVHTGDLNWWLYFLNADDDRRETVFVWEGPEGLRAWSLLTPHIGMLDVFVHPDWVGSEQENRAWAWTVERLTGLVRARGGDRLSTTWIADDDERLAACLRALGFAPAGPFYWYLERALDEPLPEAAPPGGFAVRPVAGEAEGRGRALAAWKTFNSRLPEMRYVLRYQRFMRTPAYAETLDLVAAAPDGRVAAFALAWPDLTNGVALLEPVGTHPDFQRRGLGRAVTAAALRHMQARGLRRAVLYTEHDNEPAFRLYAGLGFQPMKKMLTYEKRLD